MKYLERSVGNKKIIWFSRSNQYSLLELPAFEIIKRVLDGETIKQVIKWCSMYYELPLRESRRFVGELSSLIKQQSIPVENDMPVLENHNDSPIAHSFYSQRRYIILSKLFHIKYESAQLEYLIHPRFAHLEIEAENDADHIFSVYLSENLYTLEVDTRIIGMWRTEDIHYFTGKFSMELLNCLYSRTETDWMGVFHASALQFNNQCAMFLGDSGSGKSTLSAILMSEGFHLLADDFVPVDESENAYYFPAAVSVKHAAIDSLKPLFPKLEEAKEYYFPALNKTVRYLVPDTITDSQPAHCPCKALVFVRYVKESGMAIHELPSDIAFQRLVPDSWLSPQMENAARFLDWFLKLPCYELTYSDNEKMVAAMKQLLRYE